MTEILTRSLTRSLTVPALRLRHSRGQSTVDQYQSLVDELEEDILAAAHRGLLLRADPRGSRVVNSGSLDATFHQAFAASRLRPDDAAAAARRASASIVRVPRRRPDPSPQLDLDKLIQDQVATVWTDHLDNRLIDDPVVLSPAVDLPAPATRQRLMNGSAPGGARLRIFNRLARCIEDSMEIQDNQYRVGVVTIDHVGTVQNHGMVKMGTFLDGTTKATRWRFADLDLGAAPDAAWPRNYTAVLTLAEIDGGGFGDYIAKLLDKIREAVRSKLASIISAAVMSAVGVAAATALASAIGASAGSVVPVVGTIVGAIVGAVVGYLVAKVFGYIKEWVQDDVFTPFTQTITLDRPFHHWNGSLALESQHTYTGHDAEFELRFGFELDWGWSSLGSSRPASNVLGLSDAQAVAYRAADGFVDVQWAGKTDPTWSYGDPGWAAGAPESLSDVCYYDPSGVMPAGTASNQTIVYLDKNFAIRELWESGNGWKHGSPSQLANTMPGAGRPAGYYRHHVHHIVYRGLDSQIYCLWIQNGAWVGACLTKSAAAPAAAGDPTVLLGSPDRQSVFYRGSDGQINELFEEGTGWHHQSVTVNIAAAHAKGDPHAYSVPGTNMQVVTYRGDDDEIWTCTRTSVNSSFVAAAPSVLTGSQYAAGDPFGLALRPQPLKNPGNRHHNIVYRGIDSRIYQLWSMNDGKSWVVTDIAAGLNLPPAVSDPTAYAYGRDKYGNTRFCEAHLGADGCLYSLWFDGNTWGWVSPTKQSQPQILPGA